MADEDDIRELIGRMVAARRQGLHVTPGALRIVLTALRFYLATRTWLGRSHEDPHDDAPRKKTEPFTGPPATIGSLRQQGLVAFTVMCDAGECCNQKRVLFDDLGLPDAIPFPEIKTWRRFRCGACGGRRVRLAPDWTDHKAQGNGRQVH